ncbi:MAG: hypothetical protein JNM80_12935 [Phycisphaerae bacterium]|nr:hypothetical protein [Phycisphaerae bacterium]
MPLDTLRLPASLSLRRAATSAALSSAARTPVPAARLARRAGVIAFAFFFAKGLAWIALAALGLQAL